VLDLLNLPGVVPVDLRTGGNSIVVAANVDDGELPQCPECAKAMHRHGRRMNTFADTPMHMQSVAWKSRDRAIVAKAAEQWLLPN